MKNYYCNACPRGCNTDRTSGTGFCKSEDKIKIARASRHFWEEPCISGTNGSGTVFFSGCNMHCVYCQNEKISGGALGEDFTDEEVKELFLKISKSGVHNINLVTPTHFAPRLSKIIAPLKDEIKIPIVYNCSGYENASFIEKLEGVVDIFLTDFKYKSSDISKRYSFCPDYFDVAIKALEKMIKVTGKPQFDGDIMTKGVVVRHLILPSHKDDSIDILRELYERFGNESFLVSLMSQFTPKEKCRDFPEINRKLTSLEYKRVCDSFEKLGFKGFVQERSSATEDYIPNFEDKGEFII